VIRPRVGMVPVGPVGHGFLVANPHISNYNSTVWRFRQVAATGELAVANIEDEGFNFDDLNLPLDELTAAEPEVTAETPGELAPELAEPEAEPLETEKAEEQPYEEQPHEEPAEATAEPVEKIPRKLPAHFALGVAIAAVLVLLALALIHVLYFSTGLYLISIGLIVYATWRDRATNTVYAVILGCALAAVLTAMYCLWLELDRYQLDIKARQIKAPVSVSRLVETQRLA
jgi:hypothetical protein